MDELLEMGQDLKIKHSVSSTSTKYREHQIALHEGTNFFGQIFWGMFYMGSNDQIIQGGN